MNKEVIKISPKDCLEQDQIDKLSIPFCENEDATCAINIVPEAVLIVNVDGFVVIPRNFFGRFVSQIRSWATSFDVIDNAEANNYRLVENDLSVEIQANSLKLKMLKSNFEKFCEWYITPQPLKEEYWT